MGDIEDKFIFEVTNLNKGLESLNFNIFEFINSPLKIKYKKTTESLIHEFDTCIFKEIYDLIKDNKSIKLEHVENIRAKRELSSKNYVFYNGEHLFVEQHWVREKNIYELSMGLKYLSKKIKINTIIELGTGYGSKIISLANLNNNRNKFKFKALDISKNGLFCCKELAKRENLIVETKIQNFLINPSIGEFVDKNSIIFTSYNLHYWKDFNLNNIKQFIQDGINGGIHIEPCSDLLDKLEDKIYAALAYKYIKLNNYTENIMLAFEQAQKEKIIHLKIFQEVWGFGLLPTWIFIWYKK
ncbi:class I SAM-dependent methyltransferase [Prochlorococcus sp. MIT 0604]|uniref:class I SAM-dependent methyltransferase n=1 Tax=Prochlorococcus sp. MIT 0604 TaxID=1501268 RepID=UPI0004F6B677|nr:class I SAM-dependent methyltransferase [Prochlorococcus sp. MIT 0604]AIQ95510.1 hypothetical protein EW14_1499 [Prochlorococcus sp. MIT 0604]